MIVSRPLAYHLLIEWEGGRFKVIKEDHFDALFSAVIEKGLAKKICAEFNNCLYSVDLVNLKVIVSKNSPDCDEMYCAQLQYILQGYFESHKSKYI